MSEISNKTSQDLGNLYREPNQSSVESLTVSTTPTQSVDESLSSYVEVRLPWQLTLIGSLAGCGSTWKPMDVDEDGFTPIDGDCNDEPSEGGAAVYPGAEEVDEDGVDQNCDGCDDNLKIYYDDVDGDGYGNVLNASEPSCTTDEFPLGIAYSEDSSDCDDEDASVHPGVTDVCDDADNDCDGTVDEDPDLAVYQDADGDGIGDSDEVSYACEVSEGFSLVHGDCDDTDATTYPEATEFCDEADNDCDDEIDEEAVDESLWYADADGDGYGDESVSEMACVSTATAGFVEDSSDCNDGTEDISPEATEVCDDADNDCDGVTDEDDAADALTWYEDNDRDGYGDAIFSTVACDNPGFYTDNSDDCDDTAAAVNPVATEVCDGTDNDCNGAIDGSDAVDVETWYSDGDGDGYGAGAAVAACASDIDPTLYSYSDTDCDDTDDTINPSATEVCDSTDNDCDGDTDESLTTTYYADGDGDGYGDASVSSVACSSPTGYVEDDADCDDTSGAVSPAADEVCNSLDDDCDGAIDDDDASVTDQTTWYIDADGDGYAVSDGSITSCTASGTNTVSEQPTRETQDCDDALDTSYPGADETLDGVDNDCDSDTDEYTALFTGESADAATGAALAWVPDADGDGLDDLLIGAYTQSDASLTRQGSAYLVSGGTEGESGIESGTTIFRGESSYDRAGFQVSPAGDPDGDGEGDVLIGAFGYPSGDYNGAVYLVNGPFTASSEVALADVGSSVSGAMLYGSGYYGMFGSGLAAMGDLEGDGYEDIVVGALRYSGSGYTYGGAAFYFSGPISGSLSSSSSTAMLYGEATDLNAGDRVANVGDMDGDGINDLGVSANGLNSNSGGFYIVHGPLTSMSLSSADAVVSGSTTGVEAGQSLVGNCDVDGDGRDDVVLGATGFSTSASASYEGAVFLFTTTLSGSLSLESDSEARLEGETAGDQVGYSVSLGDVDADGFCDIATGTGEYGSTNAGAVYVTLGPVTGTSVLSSADETLNGDAGDYFGVQVNIAGDANGDGFDDLAIGASDEGDATSTEAGAAYLYLGGEL